MSERTEHGFRCGAIEVDAWAEHSKGSAVGVTVGKTKFSIEATKKGQKVYLVIPEDVPDHYRRLMVVLPNGFTVYIGGTRYGWHVGLRDAADDYRAGMGVSGDGDEVYG